MSSGAHSLRDGALFLLMGVMVGFIAAYFLFEAVGSRQPARVPAPDASQTAAAAGSVGADGQRAAQDPAALRQQAAPIEEFLAANPDVPEAWLQLANLRFDSREYPAAVTAYRKYLDLAPPDADVLTDLGVTYHLMGQPQDALEQFANAQQLAPEHWQARFNQVVVLAFDLGRYDEATAVLADLERMQPDNPEVERLATEVERRRHAA